MVRQVREFAQRGARRLRAELGPEYADLELTDLDPRTIVRKHILEAMDEADPTTDAAAAARSAPARRRRAPAVRRGRDLAPRPQAALSSGSAPPRSRRGASSEPAPLAHGDLDEVGPDPGQHAPSCAVPSTPCTTHGSPASASRRSAEPSPSRVDR